MNVTTIYERAQGRNPVDGSGDGELHDRAESSNGERRFIEVKGSALSGPVMLTGPEVDKLRQLAERTFLYLVTFCKGEKPRLHIIQNPRAQLSPHALYRAGPVPRGRQRLEGVGHDVKAVG